ncbi:MAG: hypothetical protein Q4C64_06595 [Erysipelotrichia bacterium]|nr:hypothetical protein [Erysipelotrichia bacterium]
MIYFTLPNFIEQNDINTTIAALVRRYPDKTRVKGVRIVEQTGGIPYHCWNGSINSNVGNGVYYSDLVNVQNCISLNARINCANVLLEDFDFYDNFSQTILKIFDESSTALEISSIPLMEQIQEKYPTYQFMFSKSADLITPFTQEILNEIAKSGRFYKIGIPDRVSRDMEWLSGLKKKSLYEITVDPICPIDCPEICQCAYKEQLNQLQYSGISTICSCNKTTPMYSNQQILSLEDIQDKYLSKGFQHYVFSPCYIGDLNAKVSFYITYFFKTEDQSQMLTEALTMLKF